VLAELRLVLLTAATWAAVTVPAHATQDRPVPSDVGPVAGGGAFVIQSCGESGSAAGWSVALSNPANVDGGLQCPPVNGNNPAFPDDPDQTGIWASDHLAAGGESDAGNRAEASFTTLPGTEIIQARYWRRVVRLSAPSWQSYVAFGDSSNIADTCELNGQATCGVGGGDWYPNDPNPDFDRAAYTDVTGLSTTTMIAGVYCRPNVNNICLNGSTLTRAESQIFSAYLTIADTSAPAIGTPTGDGWTTTAWSQGTLPLSLSSSDNTGIGATRVYADGSLIATLQGSCHYDRPRPCVDAPSGAAGLPTSGLADGEHVIALGAVDAAGNETRVSRSQPLRVDNRAPAAPVGLTSAAAVSSANAFSASWTLPVDAGSPIVEARYQLCQNGACGAVQTAPSLTGVAGLALPAAGTATLRVWLVDQLGHADDATAATLPLTYTPVAPPPLLPPEPEPPVEQRPDLRPQPGPPTITRTSAALKLSTTRRIGRRVTITGRLSRKTSGHVTIRYRARAGGHLRSVSHRASIKSGTFHSTFTLSHTLSTAHTATITITYTGDADTKPATAHTTLRLHTH
jgi:hypothetical protein